MRFPANSSHMSCVELALKGLPLACRVFLYVGFPWPWTDGYAMLMSPRKGETAVHGYHCLHDMAVCMCKVMARPRVGVCVPLALI